MVWWFLVAIFFFLILSVLPKSLFQPGPRSVCCLCIYFIVPWQWVTGSRCDSTKQPGTHARFVPPLTFSVLGFYYICNIGKPSWWALQTHWVENVFIHLDRSQISVKILAFSSIYVSGLIVFAHIVALRLHVGLRSGDLYFVLLSETIASQSPCFCLTRGQL